MKKLKIITLIVLIICMLIYEFGFCNLYNILKGTYSFSLFRVIIYFTIISSYIFFLNKTIEKANNTIKGKKNLIIVYILATLLYTLYIIIKQEELGRILFSIMVELLGMLFIIYITSDYIQNIIVTTLTFGIMFSLTNNVFHIMDEKQHFNSALNLAYCNFNYIKEPLGDLKFNKIEQETLMEHFVMGYSNVPYKIEMEKVEFDVKSVPMDYSPILYIPCAIGINIARLFNGTMLDVFLAGRIANLFAFMGLLILVFKLLPFRKNTFYCIYLLPQSVALAASYSIDGITVGIIGVFIAYVLKLYKENEEGINIKQFFVLITLFIICLLSKHGVYLAICIIVLILPIIKTIKKEKKIIILIISIILIAGIIGLLKLNTIAKNTSGDEKIMDTNPKLQLEFVLDNPKILLNIYENCFNSTIFDLQYYKGLNSIYFMGNEYGIIAFFLFIFCIYTATTDGTYNFRKKEKAILTLTFMATFFIGTMALYLLHTPPYTIGIYGYQVRYLVPLLPLVLMCINSKSGYSENYDEFFNTTSKNIGLFMLVDLISQIMS